MNITAAGFDWDDGNRVKCCKHGLSVADIEHVVINTDSLIVPDEKNSGTEPRYLAIGRTAAGRYAFVVFTPRRRSLDTILRPISARYMHGKEIKRYAKEISSPEN
jgi:uncharacterized DUF497 family protein